MPYKRHAVDQIVANLRKTDVELGKGKKVPKVSKLLEVTEQFFSAGDRSREFVYRSRCDGCLAVPVRCTRHAQTHSQ